MPVGLFIMVITLNLWNVPAPNGCGRAGLMLPGWPDTDRLMFTVRAIKLDFLKPARLSDNLDVSVAVGRMRKVSVELEQDVVRAGDVLCTGQVRLACVDVDTLKPKAVPKALVGET